MSSALATDAVTCGLITNAQLHQALATMSDAELDDWIAFCTTMSRRTAVATTARRQWKWLLDQALVALTLRDTEPPRHG